MTAIKAASKVKGTPAFSKLRRGERFRYHSMMFDVQGLLATVWGTPASGTYNTEYDFEVLLREGEYGSLKKDAALALTPEQVAVPVLVIDFGPGYRKQIIDGLHRAYNQYSRGEHNIPAWIIDFEEIRAKYVQELRYGKA